MTPRDDKTQRMTKIFKMLEEKLLKNSIILRVFSERLFISSQPGCWSNSGVGATTRWLGVEAIVGGQNWGCLQPLRIAVHTIYISLRNSLS